MNHGNAMKLSHEPGRISDAPVPPGTSAQELNENLAALHGLLKQLVELADRKLEGMRRADAEALQTCATQEAQLLEQVLHTEQQRDATLARLAQSLQAPELKTAPLAEIAGRFSEPMCSTLRARTIALRETATKLQQKNRLAARVAHNLQLHVRAVFAQLAKAGQESVVYGPKGQHEQTSVRLCLDAVG